MSTPTRFCVFCGERRDPVKGKNVRGIRLRFPTSDRCAEDADTRDVRFDGTTGDRLNPPPMLPWSPISSYLGEFQ